MIDPIEQEYLRICEVEQCADYMIEYNWTLREIAENVGISKSKVHTLLVKDLKYIDTYKYDECQAIMRKHKKEIKRDPATGKYVNKYRR